MSKFFIIIFVAVMPAVCFAQSTLHFTYDSAGNRTERTIVVNSSAPQLSTSSGDALFEDEDIRISTIERNVLRVEVFALKGTAQVSIYDNSGKQYIASTLNSAVSNVDISSVPDGIFILKILANRKTNTWKLIKK